MSKTAKTFVEKALSWVGKKESDGSHKSIIDIYNSHRPLARGYALKYEDAWCVGFVSAVAIACGYTDIIPTEVGCSKFIELCKKKGIWFEDENRTPNIGDIIVYDWEDDGSGDNKGTPNHVGIVSEVGSETFKVVEGNYNNAVKVRSMDINGKFIRGFACPSFDLDITPEYGVTTHIVQRGETLSKIASYYNTTVGELIQMNSSLKENPNLIKSGQVLIVPMNSEGSETLTTTDKDYEYIGMLLETLLGELRTSRTFNLLKQALED